MSLHIYIYVYLSICVKQMSIENHKITYHPRAYLYLSIYQSINLSIYLLVYLPIYLFVYLSISISIHMYIYIYIYIHMHKQIQIDTYPYMVCVLLCNLRLHWPWQRAKAGGNLFLGQRCGGTAPVSGRHRKPGFELEESASNGKRMDRNMSKLSILTQINHSNYGIEC